MDRPGHRMLSELVLRLVIVIAVAIVGAFAAWFLLILALKRISVSLESQPLKIIRRFFRQQYSNESHLRRSDCTPARTGPVGRSATRFAHSPHRPRCQPGGSSTEHVGCNPLPTCSDSRWSSLERPARACGAKHGTGEGSIPLPHKFRTSSFSYAVEDRFGHRDGPGAPRGRLMTHGIHHEYTS